MFLGTDCTKQCFSKTQTDFPILTIFSSFYGKSLEAVKLEGTFIEGQPSRRRYYLNIRNEIKAQIVRAGYTMQEVVDMLAAEHGWSDSVSNLSAKLQRGSLRYIEAIQLADVLGFDLVWQKRRGK